jgi:hypothetical protein
LIERPEPIECLPLRTVVARQDPQAEPLLEYVSQSSSYRVSRKAKAIQMIGKSVPVKLFSDSVAIPVVCHTIYTIFKWGGV